MGTTEMKFKNKVLIFKTRLLNFLRALALQRTRVL